MTKDTEIIKPENDNPSVTRHAPKTYWEMRSNLTEKILLSLIVFLKLEASPGLLSRIDQLMAARETALNELETMFPPPDEDGE